MKPRRYSLRSERPSFDAGSTLLRRGWALLLMLSLPPVAGYIWRGVVFNDWGWGVMGLLICAGFTWAVWHGLLARTTECSGRVYHRFKRPGRYWLTLALWFAFYLMSVAAFFFEHAPTSEPAKCPNPTENEKAQNQGGTL